MFFLILSMNIKVATLRVIVAGSGVFCMWRGSGTLVLNRVTLNIKKIEYTQSKKLLLCDKKLSSILLFTVHAKRACCKFLLHECCKFLARVV